LMLGKESECGDDRLSETGNDFKKYF
jgi:hypothetical protein